MRKAKSCNRLLSLVLCICMVLSLAPVQVLALDACDRGDGCRSCSVQKLVDALPDEVTAESAESVAAQLATIDSEKASLTDEELARVDFTKYTAAISAINDPASRTGTQKAVAEDTSDFHISDGVLIKYLGSAESVEIPDGVTEIGEMAFMNNYFITSVTIPKSVTTIGRGAFRNAKYLRTVNIPASVTSIGEEAFYNTDIRALHLPDSLTSIGKKAFYRSYLVTVDFYRTDNRADLVIGEQAFQGSSNLYVLSLASVSHIGSYAFLDCGNLTTLEYWGTTIPTRGSQPFSEIQVSEVKVTDAYASTLFCNIPVSVLYYSIKTSAEPSRGGYAHLLNYESRFSVPDKTVYLSALPEAGYNFVGWKYEGEIVSTAANHSFTMPAKAVTYIAVFEKNHTCDNTTYTDAGNGTHSYECSVCGINAENHSFDTGSSCTVCGAACKHESYIDGTCTACGVACGHSLDTDGLCTVCGGYEPAVLSGSVYQIGNAGQLFWFAELVNEGSTRASAVLTADITIPAGMKWTPIGNASQPYRGTFNGGDHTISGLYLSDDSADYVGLFGIVESTGKIQNTGLVETSIMAKKSVGTVTGYSLGTVERCWAENITVSATANLGGVVGLNRGTVNNCWVSGDVTMRNTSNSAGGIVGYNYGSVSNCFSLARVTGTARQGALIGTINKHDSLSTAGSVTNCYYDSSTTAVDVANVIDGTVTDVSSKTTETFASGEVAYLLGKAWGQTIGTDDHPILGGKKVHYGYVSCADDAVMEYTNNENASAEKPDHTGTLGEYEPTADGAQHARKWSCCGSVVMEEHSTAADGDKAADCNSKAYCSVCKTEYGKADPANHDKTVSFDDNGFCPHCDTYKPATLNADGCYEISNAGQLYWFMEKVNSGDNTINGVLTADIVVNRNVLQSDGTLNGDGTNFRAWFPIGYWHDCDGDGEIEDLFFSGVFDGRGHTVSGLYFNNEDQTCVGLFGSIHRNATVKNVGVIDSYLNGNDDVGAVAGYNEGAVTDCYSNASVSSGDGMIGGVVGENQGAVENCYHTGAVIGNNEVGGVVGSNDGAVTNCYHNGTVSGENYVGGAVGENSGAVTNCYNTGAVSGGEKVGGVVGYNEGTVTNCYNTGAVSCSGRGIGGVEGGNTGAVTNCYYLDTCGASGNGTAKTADQFASGEVAYLLNGDQTTIVFKQTIGTDASPNFTGKTVYYGYPSCAEDAQLVYSNNETIRPDHSYENGICASCGAYESAVLNDGIYTISNAGQLLWFAELVNAGNFTAGAVLTSDIDMDGLHWTPIGTQTAYTGTFDGRGFAIKNLWQNSDGTNGNKNGLVVILGAGGTVMGVTIDHAAIWGADFYSTNATGAIANRNAGVIRDCVVKNSSIQQGAYEYLGGIAGENSGTIENCAVIGCSFSRRWGGTDAGSMGAIAQTNNGTVKNCFSYGCSFNNGRADKAAIVAVNNGTLENCYYYTTGTVATTYGAAKTAEQFASGEVAYLLGEAFGQTIGADDHPILSGAKVYQVTNCKGETAYSNTEENGAHTEQTVTGKAPTCTETGLTDGVICSVCGETIAAQEEIPVLGHSYEDNVCTVCGHIGVPVKLDSASLSFKEKIHYNIFFSLGLDETVDLSDMGLVMFDSLKADGTMDDAIAIYAGAVEMDGKYMVATDGVPAKYMGDTIYFRAYAKLADGSYVYSKTVEYSAVTYAEHILNSDKPESAKALVVAMLNYGAAAQMFFGYNTDNLVNTFLTDEQKALPEQYRDDMANTVPVVAGEKQGVFANNKGFSKRMPAVSFEGAFEINYFFTPAYVPVDGITLYYWTEADFEANEILTVDNATGSLKLEGTGTEQYRSDIGGIAAKNLSENIYVAAVYSDGTTTWTSGVLGYSIGAYCGRLAAKGGAMADLAMETAVYGYHAKQYFGS